MLEVMLVSLTHQQTVAAGYRCFEADVLFRLVGSWWSVLIQ
jgi:hypothetical protein